MLGWCSAWPVAGGCWMRSWSNQADHLHISTHQSAPAWPDVCRIHMRPLQTCRRTPWCPTVHMRRQCRLQTCQRAPACTLPAARPPHAGICSIAGRHSGCGCCCRCCCWPPDSGERRLTWSESPTLPSNSSAPRTRWEVSLRARGVARAEGWSEWVPTPSRAGIDCAWVHAALCSGPALKAQAGTIPPPRHLLIAPVKLLAHPAEVAACGVGAVGLPS